MKSIHLPYQIDPSGNRHHFYETLWKIRALELLSRHDQNLSGLSLLDYGCGRGETLELAKELGIKTSGTDLDPECVRISSALGECSILDANDPLRQFGENSFDIVTCFHVLEHVPSPVETLNALRAISRKYVLLAVPNGSRFPDLFRPKRNLYGPNEGHLQLWDHSHLRNLAENHCGLKLIDWTFDNVKLPILSNQFNRLFGDKFIRKLETGLFKSLFPYQSTSVIGLFVSTTPS